MRAASSNSLGSLLLTQLSSQMAWGVVNVTIVATSPTFLLWKSPYLLMIWFIGIIRKAAGRR